MTSNIKYPVLGKRVYPDNKGCLNGLQPGEYGRGTWMADKHPAMGWWEVRAPDGNSCILNPETHTVVEHQDGTITVSPSIDMNKAPWFGFHGWLKNGIWTSVEVNNGQP